LQEYAGIKLRGLPYSIKKEDIMFFFSDFKFYLESIKIGKNADNTKTGEGALLFKNEDESKRAFNEKQG
jgi:heterogeneous nuclear ribonucleoprotein F/H